MTNQVNQVATQVVTLNHAELEQFIISKENSNFQQLANWHLRTKPTDFVMKSKIDSTINPYWSNFINDEIEKDQHKRGALLTDYQVRVINNSLKEGIDTEFIPQAPKGKEHISKCVLKDTATGTKRYVSLEYYAEIKDKAPTYLLNGTEIDYMLLKNWHNRKQYQAEQNGQSRKVNIITPSFDSIVDFKYNGVLYIIDHN